MKLNKRFFIFILIISLISITTLGCISEEDPIAPPANEDHDASTSTIDIIVNSPKPSDVVDGSIDVIGEARVFENNVRIRLKDGNNETLVDTFTTAEGDAGELSPFSKNIEFDTPNTAEGVLEVFEDSANDTGEVNKVTIRVIFQNQ